MHCPFCGVSVPDHATFCPECGSNLQNERIEARPSPQPTPQSASEPAPIPKPSPRPEPPAAQPEKKRPNKALIIAIAAACIVALAVACFAASNSAEPEPPMLTGITTSDVYDNAYFDISIPRGEGFAFASESEIEQLMGSAKDIALDSDLAKDTDLLDECAYDTMLYDPVVGDIVIVVVFPPEIPQSLSDEEILSACDDGLTSALSKSDIDSTKGKDSDMQIAGIKRPGIRHNAEINGSSAFLQSALLKTDNHAAVILAFSLSEDRLEEMLARIEPSTGIQTDSSSDDDNKDYDDGEEFPAYEAGTTDGNTYRNPYFGVTLTLPEGFELLDTSDFSSNPGNAAASEATSSPFATDTTYELTAANYSTGEVLIFYSQKRPASYAHAYTSEQMAEFAITHTDADLFNRQFAASGVSDTQTEERTYSAAGRDYPGLYTNMTLAGIPASASLTCIAHGNRVMYLSCTMRGEGHFEEFLSLITYDEASKG